MPSFNDTCTHSEIYFPSFLPSSRSLFRYSLILWVYKALPYATVKRTYNKSHVYYGVSKRWWRL